VSEPDRIGGIDEPLPDGERLLWQGAPHWPSLAVRAFHVRKAALYFGVLVLWRIASSLADGVAAGTAAASAAGFVALALLGLGLLAGLAWAASRTTIYALTDRRIVMRIGIALPMTVNLPLARLDAAALKPHRDGTGSIALALKGDDRIAWLHLWPHVRPWRLARTQPMLRSVPDAARVAALLGRAASGAGHAPSATPADPVAPAPSSPPLVGATS
jgi:hypothetical protein